MLPFALIKDVTCCLFLRVCFSFANICNVQWPLQLAQKAMETWCWGWQLQGRPLYGNSFERFGSGKNCSFLTWTFSTFQLKLFAFPKYSQIHEHQEWNSSPSCIDSSAPIRLHRYITTQLRIFRAMRNSDSEYQKSRSSPSPMHQLVKPLELLFCGIEGGPTYVGDLAGIRDVSHHYLEKSCLSCL